MRNGIECGTHKKRDWRMHPKKTKWFEVQIEPEAEFRAIEGWFPYRAPAVKFRCTAEFKEKVRSYGLSNSQLWRRCYHFSVLGICAGLNGFALVHNLDNSGVDVAKAGGEFAKEIFGTIINLVEADDIKARVLIRRLIQCQMCVDWWHVLNDCIEAAERIGARLTVQADEVGIKIGFASRETSADIERDHSEVVSLRSALAIMAMGGNLIDAAVASGTARNPKIFGESLLRQVPTLITGPAVEMPSL